MTFRLSRPQSLLAASLGAVAGLLIAGYGLFTAEGTRTLFFPSGAIALVNNRPIARVDYLAQLRAQYNVSLNEATHEQKRKTLDDMIDEELLMQRGIELGVQNDDSDVRAALVSAAQSHALQNATRHPPSESTLRTWYTRHKPAYQNRTFDEAQPNIMSDYLLDAARLNARADTKAFHDRADIRIKEGLQ